MHRMLSIRSAVLRSNDVAIPKVVKSAKSSSLAPDRERESSGWQTRSWNIVFWIICFRKGTSERQLSYYYTSLNPTVLTFYQSQCMLSSLQYGQWHRTWYVTVGCVFVKNLKVEIFASAHRAAILQTTFSAALSLYPTGACFQQSRMRWFRPLL